MGKKIFAILLLTAFAIQTFNRVIITCNFYLHRSYIAATQCENRSRPMLHCNGQCQLAKRLKQQENKDQQNPERKLENKNEVISWQSFLSQCPVFAEPASTAFFIFSDNRTFRQSFSVFHPPCA
jgi:hypothetical protein